MKNLIIIAGVIILVIIAANMCNSGEEDYDDSEEYDELCIDSIRERVADVECNVLILESGLRVTVIGTRADNEWVETYLRAHVLGHEVRLVADRRLKETYTEADSVVPAYVIISEGRPSVNHSIIIDNPRAFDASMFGDSLEAFKPRKNRHNEISDIAMYMKMRTFLIQTPFGLGTGFFINDDGLALTNNHVLSDTDAKIFLYDRKAHDNNNVDTDRFLRVNTIYETDTLLDITIFKVQLNSGEKVDYFDLADKHVAQGTRVATYGNPDGMTGSFASGYLSGYYTIDSQPLLKYEIDTKRGNSGGPVVEPRGTIVAVHSHGDTTQQRDKFGIDILAVRRLLDKHQLKYGGL